MPLLCDVGKGDLRKMACLSCIRGHRASKCDHIDRILVEVRKPGRPLSSCPHPSGSCSCHRTRVTYIIPTTSRCAATERFNKDEPLPVVRTGSQSLSRAERHRHKRSQTFNMDPAANNDNAGAMDTKHPSSAPYPPSEGSSSNGASMPSSGGSTPFIPPNPSGPPNQASVLDLPGAYSQPSMASPMASSCCQAKQAPRIAPKVELNAPQSGGCCGSMTDKPVDVQTVQNPAYLPAYSQSAMPGPFTPSAQSYHAPTNLNFGHSSNNFTNYMVPPNMGADYLAKFETTICDHTAPRFQSYMPDQAPSSPTCKCGDSCTCLACLEHPRNPTTHEYVRLATEYMTANGISNNSYDMSMFAPFSSTNTNAYSGTPFNTTANTLMHSTAGVMPHSTQTTENTWDGNMPLTQPLATMESHIQEDFDAENPSDETILSPSHFKVHELELPGCSEPGGLCGCGDGCTCANCQTHGSKQSYTDATPNPLFPTPHSGMYDMYANTDMTWFPNHIPSQPPVLYGPPS
ncbi:hypothetical protein M011DRAFT_90155 [Sporormia fimetaria CBS 119925]|uniref:Copper-fist domain-containing protein n=1 Tax=Sporormia fimetaria CBS 119925 TaxID=1340428 RepID=A0A6A6V842_9PLEO|nr:hypothetical protein M011DRAFT_90155 [Sporormia fimetaria CBS 119925]